MIQSMTASVSGWRPSLKGSGVGGNCSGKSLLRSFPLAFSRPRLEQMFDIYKLFNCDPYPSHFPSLDLAYPSGLRVGRRNTSVPLSRSVTLWSTPYLIYMYTSQSCVHHLPISQVLSQENEEVPAHRLITMHVSNIFEHGLQQTSLGNRNMSQTKLSVNFYYSYLTNIPTELYIWNVSPMYTGTN